MEHIDSHAHRDCSGGVPAVKQEMHQHVPDAVVIDVEVLEEAPDVSAGDSAAQPD